MSVKWCECMRARLYNRPNENNKNVCMQRFNVLTHSFFSGRVSE